MAARQKNSGSASPTDGTNTSKEQENVTSEEIELELIQQSLRRYGISGGRYEIINQLPLKGEFPTVILLYGVRYDGKNLVKG